MTYLLFLAAVENTTMVDVDKKACRTVAEQGYLAGLWLKSYLTWEFLKEHPKAMELGYLYVNWNHIPGMYCQKNYLHSLVIEQDEWDHLSDPTYLAHYWKPTQEPGDFHRTFALAICQSHYFNCKDPSHKDEYLVSVAVIQKPASFAGIPFSLAVDRLSDPDEKESTLLIVHLHRQSRLFPDIYYDWYYSHFTLMHMSGEHYNVGYPQEYMGGLLHNAYEAGEESNSPKAKLPLAFVDSMVYLFQVDSCVWLYWDWTMDHEDRPALEEHFVWLSEETMPFCTDSGQPHVLSDFTLGLADVSDWPAWDGEPPWIFDPKECPKLVHPDPGSTGLGSASPGAENGSWKRKNRKKHHRRLKSEVKVTNHGEGKDSPVWSQGGPGSSSESSASGVDSGFSSILKWQGVNTTRATIVQGDRTPLLSPATVKKLDARDYDDDDPLSDCLDYKPSDNDQEMAIVEEQPRTTIGDGETGPKETGTGKKDTGRNLGNPANAQDPVLPSTSAQQLGPTRPDFSCGNAGPNLTGPSHYHGTNPRGNSHW